MRCAAVDARRAGVATRDYLDDCVFIARGTVQGEGRGGGVRRPQLARQRCSGGARRAWARGANSPCAGARRGTRGESPRGSMESSRASAAGPATADQEQRHHRTDQDGGDGVAPPRSTRGAAEEAVVRVAGGAAREAGGHGSPGDALHRADGSEPARRPRLDS